MNSIPLALYLAALVAYMLHFARRQPDVGRAATTLLVAGALAHTFVVGMQTMDVGHVPVTNASSAISTFVLLLVLAYLYTEMTTEERAMGAFILPLVVALQTIPALHPMAEEKADVLHGPLFGIHVSSLLFAYASFALACVIGRRRRGVVAVIGRDEKQIVLAQRGEHGWQSPVELAQCSIEPRSVVSVPKKLVEIY